MPIIYITSLKDTHMADVVAAIDKAAQARLNSATPPALPAQTCSRSLHSTRRVVQYPAVF